MAQHSPSAAHHSKTSASRRRGRRRTEEEDGDASEREEGGEEVSAEASRCKRVRGAGGFNLVNEEAGKGDGGLAEVKNNRQRRLPGARLWVHLGDVDQSCWLQPVTSLHSNITTKTKPAVDARATKRTRKRVCLR